MNILKKNKNLNHLNGLSIIIIKALSGCLGINFIFRT
jgi:hypothetical protein